MLTRDAREVERKNTANLEPVKATNIQNADSDAFGSCPALRGSYIVSLLFNGTFRSDVLQCF